MSILYHDKAPKHSQIRHCTKERSRWLFGGQQRPDPPKLPGCGRNPLSEKVVWETRQNVPKTALYLNGVGQQKRCNCTSYHNARLHVSCVSALCSRNIFEYSSGFEYIQKIRFFWIFVFVYSQSNIQIRMKVILRYSSTTIVGVWNSWSSSKLPKRFCYHYFKTLTCAKNASATKTIQGRHSKIS